MKRGLSLAASVILHAVVLLVPLSDPATARTLDFIAVTFPENVPVPAASVGKFESGKSDADPRGALFHEEPGAVSSADPVHSEVEIAAHDVVRPAAQPVQEPVTASPAPVAAILKAVAAQPAASVMEAFTPSRPIPEGIVWTTAEVRGGALAGASSTQGGASADPEEWRSAGVGLPSSMNPPEGSSAGGGTGSSSDDRTGSGVQSGMPGGGTGGGGGGMPGNHNSVRVHLANYRAAVARKVGAEAERRFRRRAVREDEGLVMVRVRVHGGAGLDTVRPGEGCMELIAVQADKPLLADIIDDALRAVDAPAPPAGIPLPVEISFRFRFVLN